jgi:hypothetical protein
MSGKKSGSFKIGRSAITGQFKPVDAARQHPRTNVVETIKKSGGKK